ncbi:MAG TPA: YfbM family protein [Chitinispirillaceae bacterium]|nr:YfbM family protein [Chitinispirillaceae bacterium]
MSLTLLVQPLSDGNLSHLLKKPSLIWKVIRDNKILTYETVRTRSQLFGNLFDHLIKNTGFTSLLKRNGISEPDQHHFLSINERGCGNLDTAWHAIHYMLSGSVFDGTFPMDFLLFGGIDIGTVDVGFGPARAISSSQVKEIHTFLSGLPTEVFMNSYDADALTTEKIYPEIWYRFYADEENRAFIRDKYEILKYNVSKAAENNFGLLLWISTRNACADPVSSLSMM